MRAAQALLDTARAEVTRAQARVDSDIVSRASRSSTRESPAQIALVAAVDNWLAVRQEVQAPLEEVRRTFNEYADSLQPVRSRRTLIRNLVTRAARTALPEHLLAAEAALSVARRVLDSHLTETTLNALARRHADPDQALTRYRRNNAYFVAALEHLRDELSPERRPDSSVGGLPADVAARVEATPLLTGAFTSILRRYQDFGARYIVSQQRVILGDEMGLGKTVQALAAICHLHALGARNILVIAPNSVMINWEREVVAHTSLQPIVLHGAAREELVATWMDSGHVGITTFGTFPKISHLMDRLDVIVVDEAHHVKNPSTLRATAVNEAAARSGHVILMTGTALENRLAEMHSLATLAQPDLRQSVESLATYRHPDPDVVATMLSPVYLRRTQRDVLTELPERIVIDEVVDLSPDDRAAYLEAPPNLMQKRLVATVGSRSELSSKYERLVELVDDHREAEHKIVVFSFFRTVVADVALLSHSSFVITGDTTPFERQRIIDAFQTSPPGSVLVAQIEAGGVGVNLQMAQVAILMEPQFKPSTEWQAIARIHRMGQSKTVIVHRLIARGTVDEHLVNLILAKELEFFAYAHDSAVKHESRMATDTSSANVAQRLQRLLDEGQID